MTGGGSGIGRCTAHELAALGANVVILGRTIEKLSEVQREIEEDGGQAMSYACDIRDETMVVGAGDAVLTKYGRIDGLVNNAGGQFRSPLKAISTKGFEAVVRNNLTGGFIFMREVYNRWMEANGGAIVNIIADIWHGWPEFGHSAAARGGMLTLTETAACEWSASGVRVNAVAPGGIVSSGFDTYTPEMQKKLHEFTEHVPLQRFGTEAEIRPPSPTCFRLQPPTSPAPASASMVEHRTLAPPGNLSFTAAACLSKVFIVRNCQR